MHIEQHVENISQEIERHNDNQRRLFISYPCAGCVDAFISLMPQRNISGPAERAIMNSKAKSEAVNVFGGKLGVTTGPLPWKNIPTNNLDLSDNGKRLQLLNSKPILYSTNTNIRADTTQALAAYYTLQDGVEVCHHTYRLIEIARGVEKYFKFDYIHDGFKYCESFYITMQFVVQK